MVFNTMFGPAMLNAEPKERNSNLLPVKANGEVLFLSVVSLGNLGSADKPISKVDALEVAHFPSMVQSTTSVNSSPKKMEMIVRSFVLPSQGHFRRMQLQYQ